MRKFKKGQAVVCVNPTGFLSAGSIYTVSDFIESADGNGVCAVTVNECINLPGTIGYISDRFKLVEVPVFLDEDDLDAVNEVINYFERRDCDPSLLNQLRLLSDKIGEQLY